MKTAILICVMVLFLVSCSEPESEVPKIGSSMVIDGENTIVVGAGDTPFEYIGTGESLILDDLLREGYRVVVVPKEGEVVKVDPSIPSLTVGGKEMLNEYSLPSTFVLVEYDRMNN